MVKTVIKSLHLSCASELQIHPLSLMVQTIPSPSSEGLTYYRYYKFKFSLSNIYLSKKDQSLRGHTSLSCSGLPSVLPLLLRLHRYESVFNVGLVFSLTRQGTSLPLNSSLLLLPNGGVNISVTLSMSP